MLKWRTLAIAAVMSLGGLSAAAWADCGSCGGGHSHGDKVVCKCEKCAECETCKGGKCAECTKPCCRKAKDGEHGEGHKS